MRFPLTGAALAGCCISAIACLLLQPPANAAQGPAPAQAQPPALAPAARAAAQKKYDNIFGAEDKSVANRGNPRDEVAFAAKLLDGYKKVPEDPALQTLILLRVQVLGSKDPAGYGVACEALQALQTLDPPNAAVYRSQLLDLLRQRTRRAPTNEDRLAAAKWLFGVQCESAEALYDSHRYSEAVDLLKDAVSLAGRFRLPVSDQLRRRMELFAVRRDAAVSLEKLKSKLNANPTDRQLQKQTLITAVLLLDDPAAVAKMASDFDEGDTPRMILLASKPVSEVTAANCSTLSDWYGRLAQENPGPGHGTALLRALRYEQRNLELHGQGDADRLAVLEKLLNLEKSAATGPHGLRTADRVVIWNQHNGEFNDRGTRQVELSFYSHGQLVYEKKAVPLPWQPNKDASLEMPLPPLIFDSLKVGIVSFSGTGGGLAEVEVIRGEENIALHAAAKASASYNDQQFGAAAVVDGITTSRNWSVGYWLLPDGTPGWVEIPIRAPLPRQ